MFGDIMSGYFNESTISEITLSVLDDLGFYKINYYTGGLFKFGKNKGCKFLNASCLSSDGSNNVKAKFIDEFCSNSSEVGCARNRNYKATCSIKTYNNDIPSVYRYFTNEPKKGGNSSTDYCPVYEDYSVFNRSCAFGTQKGNYENLAKNSFCFVGYNLTKSGDTATVKNINNFCFDVVCYNDYYQVNLNDAKVNCSKEGDVAVTGFTGKLHCYNYDDICVANVTCNNIFDCAYDYSVPNNLYTYNKSLFDEYYIKYSHQTLLYFNSLLWGILISTLFIYL